MENRYFSYTTFIARPLRMTPSALCKAV